MIPPEFAPHRTATQQLGDDIVKHAAAIRRGWPHMLPEDAPPQRLGRASVSAGILREGDDDDAAEDDLGPHTLLMHRRRNTMEVLNGWCRAVMEDRDITNPKSLPLGTDVDAMCRFIERQADWIGWQEFATDCRDELEEIAHTVGAYSDPWRREFHRVGVCTFIVDDKFCDGTVRVQIGADESEATCSGCGQVAPIEWWEEVMGVVVHVDAVRATALAAILSDRLKVTVNERTIRRWCAGGRLTPLVAFGPQPLKPNYWFDARRAVEEVALMDRPCSTCGRPWSGKGAVCGRCYATVTHASPRYAEPRNMMTPVKVQMVRLPDPPRVEDEKVLCPGSDLPVAWCGCRRHAV